MVVCPRGGLHVSVAYMVSKLEEEKGEVYVIPTQRATSRSFNYSRLVIRAGDVCGEGSGKAGPGAGQSAVNLPANLARRIEMNSP